MIVKNIHFTNFVKYWEHDSIRRDIKSLYRDFFTLPVPNSVHDLQNMFVSLVNQTYLPNRISWNKERNAMSIKYVDYRTSDEVYKMMMIDINKAFMSLFNKHGIPLYKVIQTTIKTGDYVLFKSSANEKYIFEEIIFDDIFNCELRVASGVIFEEQIIMNYGLLTKEEKKDLKSNLYTPIIRVGILSEEW